MLSVTTSWLLLAHAGATVAMTGLIWFVQVVHYPLFSAVGAEAFAAYHRAHARLTTLVVGPLMVTEAATAVWLVVVPTPAVTPILTSAGLVLLVVVWAVTALASVPYHDALAGRFAASPHAGLVATNWIRTVAWSARAALALAMVHATMPVM